MWLHKITLAPFLIKSSMVGSAARMRVSSLIFPVALSMGTLKSTRTKTRLPAKSASVKFATVFFGTAHNLLDCLPYNKD